MKILGLELRKTPVDDAFRLRPDALDLDGACAVVATVGTTSTASVDPVPAIADACAEAGVWLHVDAAYAGSAMVCPELRWAFEGVDRADSLVVNAHKWMLVPVDCSLVWSRRPEALAWRVQPRARVPADGRRGRQHRRVRAGAGPPLSARSSSGPCFAATGGKGSSG